MFLHAVRDEGQETSSMATKGTSNKTSLNLSNWVRKNWKENSDMLDIGVSWASQMPHHLFFDYVRLRVSFILPDIHIQARFWKFFGHKKSCENRASFLMSDSGIIEWQIEGCFMPGLSLKTKRGKQKRCACHMSVLQKHIFFIFFFFCVMRFGQVLLYFSFFL